MPHDMKINIMPVKFLSTGSVQKTYKVCKYSLILLYDYVWLLKVIISVRVSEGARSRISYRKITFLMSGDNSLFWRLVCYFCDRWDRSLRKHSQTSLSLKSISQYIVKRQYSSELSFLHWINKRLHKNCVFIMIMRELCRVQLSSSCKWSCVLPDK